MGKKLVAQPVEKIVAVVDLSRYSDICKELEQQLDVTAVAAVNQQVKDLIFRALAAAGVTPAGLPYKGTGDGAIIVLDTVDQGHQFAEHLHLEADKHNRFKDVPLARRHFRVGMWAGAILLQPQQGAAGELVGFDFAGTSIANAVRLEGACKTGEVLVGSDVWASLPPEVRVQYGAEEVVKGKRSEEFRAHRRRVTPPASWDEAVRPEGGKPAGNPKRTKPDDLTEIHRRRLTDLQLQAAKFGYNTPPHINMEIEDLRRIIADLESGG